MVVKDKIYSKFQEQIEMATDKEKPYLAKGLACLIATKTISYSEDEMKELLGSAVRQMIYGYKNNIK